jgi:hypothetical protein
VKCPQKERKRMKRNVKIRMKSPKSPGGGVAALHRLLFRRKGDVTFVVLGGALKSISVFTTPEDGELDED